MGSVTQHHVSILITPIITVTTGNVTRQLPVQLNYPYYNSNDGKCYATPCTDSSYPYYNSNDGKCYATPCTNLIIPITTVTTGSVMQHPVVSSYPYYNSNDGKCYATPCTD